MLNFVVFPFPSLTVQWAVYEQRWLSGKTEDYQNCAALCATVVHIDMRTYMTSLYR